ncbi:hypothetical protein BCR34DRAFT_28524 [Clohesyomyces aquaticus]|uniref:Uncharacterized protein n=1 Tax=Clohesyomyces aquaticus TaxID=1231657 RepID=A0A1Y1ZA63_9PLEO|nr:hypothetical protein BCR34DRAFT_28524 [Clohesyomyces aquaticus]
MGAHWTGLLVMGYAASLAVGTPINLPEPDLPVVGKLCAPNGTTADIIQSHVPQTKDDCHDSRLTEMVAFQFYEQEEMQTYFLFHDCECKIQGAYVEMGISPYWKTSLSFSATPGETIHY